MERSLVAFAGVVLVVGACGKSGDDGATNAGGASSVASSTSSSGASSSSSTGSSSSSGAGGGGVSSSSSSSGSGGSGGGSMDPPGWKLVWSDEFNGPDGADVDPTKWVHVESGNGNGNQERQYYTPGPANAHQGGGDLHIVAMAGSGGFNCWYGPCQYTSGKLVSKDWNKPSLFEKQFGRFSARMKTPGGQGTWPAFWMLGNDIEKVNWPVCGEIDAMESIGKAPATAFGTVHGPDASNQNVSDGGSQMLAMGALADDFHVYTVEWKQGEVKFLLDDVAYFTSTPASFKGTWVFDDHPYYLLLNLAIGGSWPGDPDGTTKFPAELLVDWVRVYDPAP